MTKKEENVSIVNTGVSIEGTIRGKGRLVINGTVKGKIEGDVVIVGESGKVEAETCATEFTLGGLFEGELKAKSLTILPTGMLTGNVTCRDLVVESGGRLNGRVNRVEEK